MPVPSFLKNRLWAGLVGAAIALGAPAASAATFTFDLFDHPDGANRDSPDFHDYGLRLDQYNNRHFSFDHGSTATLVYNDVAGTAVISGTMRESLFGQGAVGDFWTISYTLTGLTDLGGGAFVDNANSGGGSISFGNTTLQLGSKSNMDNPPYSFKLDDDGHRIQQQDGQFVGRGWVNYQNGGGANDFLFLAQINDNPPGPNAVPLPAAGWMLFAGLGGLGALRRFKS